MNRSMVLLVAAVLAASASLAGIPRSYAQAGDLPPGASVDRNANVWGGKDHQPKQTDVATKLQREIRESDEVDPVRRQLEEMQRRYPPGFLEEPSVYRRDQ